MAFAPAKLTKAWLRMAIMGPAGAGKTFTALSVAKGLAGEGGRIALLDTEGGSAAKYADRFTFDMDTLTDHNPANFIAMIKLAETAGYSVLILDSISHEWAGKGGALDRNTNVHAPKVAGNSYMAWGKTGAEHQAFLDAILNTPIHIIATLRQKMGYEQTEENGKKKIVKLGMQPVQRDGAEYEFDTVWEMDQAHNATVTKDRSGFLQDETLQKPGAELGQKLKAWLDRGEDRPVEVQTVPQSEAPGAYTENPPLKPSADGPRKATDKQMKMIGALIGTLTGDSPEAKELLRQHLRDKFNVQSATELTIKQASEAIEWLNAMKAADEAPEGEAV